MSEIVTHQVRKLKTVVDSLDLAEEGEILSPHKCLMIHQVDESTTEYTSYSPRRARFTYRLSGEEDGGEVGTQYIVDHPGLRTEIDNFNSARRSQLSFSDAKGRLIIKANERVDEQGNTDYDAISYCNLYGGSAEEFDPPEQLAEEQFIGAIYREHLLQILKTMEKFGGNEHDNIFYLRAEGGYLVAATNFGVSSSGYIFVARPINSFQVDDVIATSIPRKHIPRLRFLVKDLPTNELVNMYYDQSNNWIEFGCTLGSFLVKGSEANQQIVNALLTTASSNQTFHAARNIDVDELVNTFQQFRNSKTNKLLLWSADQGRDPIIRCNEMDLISDSKFAKINTEFEGDLDQWVSCGVEGSMMRELVSSLNKVTKEADKDRDTETNSSTKGVVTVQQYKNEQNPRIVLLYVFVDKHAYQDTCFGLLYGQDLKDQLDEVDSDD